MKITLKRATLDDCERIHKMQLAAFRPLLERYRDYQTSPATEKLERTEARLKSPFSDYYLIQLVAVDIGAIRVEKLECNAFRIARLFVLPAYQGKGYAQQAITEAEALYPGAARWELDTIKEETRLCHLYEKMGYRLTGEERSVNGRMTIVDYEKRL